MENGPTYSGDSGLPRSLTDSDFQALSLEVAQARAEAQKTWASDSTAPQDQTEEFPRLDVEPDSHIDLPATQANDAQADQTQAGQARSGDLQASDLDWMRSGINPYAHSPGPQDFAPMLCNLPIAELMEHALLRAEGVLSDRGALCVRTLPYSGKTPGSYYCVDPTFSQATALETSRTQRQQPLNPITRLTPMDESTFWSLYQRAVDYSEDKALYQCDGSLAHQHHAAIASNPAASTQKLHVICELASHAIMVRHWLGPISSEDGPENNSEDPPPEDPQKNGKFTEHSSETSSEQDLTVIALPGLRGEPWLEPLLETEVFVAIHPGQRLALIGGSRYGGDLLGAITMLLHELHRATPATTLLIPDAVQCSVSETQTALFLGAAGSGKQTLAAALSQTWQRGPILGGLRPQPLEASKVAQTQVAQPKVAQPKAIQSPASSQVKTPSQLASKFEIQPLLAGGYGNVTGLAPESPLSQRLSFGAVLENVPLQESSSRPRFSDLGSSIPFRAAWQHIIANSPTDILSSHSQPGHSQPGHSQPGNSQPGHSPGNWRQVQAIFLLVADTSGVLPAIARLAPAQAIYYLTLGYGADLPGWNRHQLTPTAHFTAMDHPRALANALRWQTCLQAQQSPTIAQPEIYLVNTGWLGPEGEAGRSLQQRIPTSISQALVQAALAGEIPLASEESCQIAAPPQSQPQNQSKGQSLDQSPDQSPGQSPGQPPPSPPTCVDPVFGWTVPSGSQQRVGHWCQPWNCWGNAQDWQVAAIALAEQFQSQMADLIKAGLPDAIAQAGPGLAEPNPSPFES